MFGGSLCSVGKDHSGRWGTWSAMSSGNRTRTSFNRFGTKADTAGWSGQGRLCGPSLLVTQLIYSASLCSKTNNRNQRNRADHKSLLILVDNSHDRCSRPDDGRLISSSHSQGKLQCDYQSVRAAKETTMKRRTELPPAFSNKKETDLFSSRKIPKSFIADHSGTCVHRQEIPPVK